MRSRSILDLVEFVVFEVRGDGQVSARNTGAVKLLDALLTPEPRLQALFNKATVPEVTSAPRRWGGALRRAQPQRRQGGLGEVADHPGDDARG
ncbi:MAG: hypothetical protein IPO67_23395 [Deltaproteobacteria bacterium]|nr:hypothetical protein [Deltaproteobacteria bacterium]